MTDTARGILRYNMGASQSLCGFFVAMSCTTEYFAHVSSQFSQTASPEKQRQKLSWLDAFKELGMFRRNWSPRRNTPGYVYILRGSNGLYKIGSTNGIDRRVWEVSHYSGIKSELYFSTETKNMNDLEKRLHKHFKTQRVFNEWFDLNAEQLGEAVLLMEKG